VRKMKLTIGTKLIISFGLIALILASLALYSAIISQKSLEESVGRNSLSLATEIITRIDQSIYYRIEELQEFTKGKTLQKTLLKVNADFEKLDDIKEYINQKDQEWTSVPKDEITSFMQNLIQGDLSDAFRIKFTEFYEEKYGYKIFTEVFLTNKYGANIAQTGKTSDYRQDDEEWWQSAREKGIYVGDVYYDESSYTRGIEIGVKVNDEKGNFIGVINAIIAAEEIIREAEIAAKEYKTTEIKLLTKEGRLIYSSKPFKFLEDVTMKDFFKKLEGEKGVFISEEGSKKNLFSYIRSKGYLEFEGLQWVLLINHDEEEILASTFMLRNRILFISFILILVTVLIAFILSRSIVKPVIKLRNTALEIAQGNLDKKVKVSSNDEIGQLATAFNEMTRKLYESYINLKREVTERKEVQEQLVRSEKLAVLGQLAGGVGHELRNPLSSIKNAAYFLKMALEKPEPEVKETLEILEKEVATSEHIISSLLDFARPKPPISHKMNINDLLQEVLSHTIVPENIKVESQLDKLLPEILADPEQLSQVFRNIILNALQAMPDGGRLKIRTESFPPSQVTVSFADTGAGIPKDNLEKLFEPLFTTKAKGIGLGLAITKTLIERHGGTIEVQSEVKKGSIFTVKLPIKEKKKEKE